MRIRTAAIAVTIGPNTEDLNHMVITRARRIGAAGPIQGGWTGFTNAALVVVPGGLRAFWGGFRTTDTNDPQRVRRDERTAVRFTVLDAGAPVKGAKVKVGGESGTTDRRGRVTLSLTSRRPVTARATHSGYAAASKRLGVCR
jgi:hypothetical protein